MFGRCVEADVEEMMEREAFQVLDAGLGGDIGFEMSLVSGNDGKYAGSTDGVELRAFRVRSSRTTLSTARGSFITVCLSLAALTNPNLCPERGLKYDSPGPGTQAPSHIHLAALANHGGYRCSEMVQISLFRPCGSTRRAGHAVSDIMPRLRPGSAV
jgi:hypothetical protein